jgi:hypothetical protein
MRRKNLVGFHGEFLRVNGGYVGFQGAEEMGWMEEDGDGEGLSGGD